VPLKEDFKNFGAADCNSLKAVRIETWGGFIFVNLDQSARPLLETYGDILRKCDFIRAGELRTAWRFTLEVNSNWKLLVENFYDVYHLNVVHANSFAKDFNPHDFKLQTMSGGTFFGEYRSQSLAAPDGTTLFRSIEWMPGDDKMAFGAQVLPTLTLIGRHDGVYVFVAEPLGVGKCRLTTSMLIPPAWFHEPDFKAKIDQYESFMKLILAEDLDLLASLQLGLASEAYVPGPASDLESPVLHVTRDVLLRLSDPA
jgi:Rieske 2Fe-2S family protein